MAIRTVTGSVRRRIDHTPLRDTLIEVWDRDFGLDDCLGRGRTNDDGRFEIKYDTEEAGDDPDMSVKVIRLNAHGERETIEHWDGPSNVTTDIELDPIEIAGWEYDPAYSVPLVFSNGAGVTSSPQNFELPQAGKILLHGTTLGAARLAAGAAGTIAGAQSFFHESRTQRMERENPGSTADDGYFVDSVLNGFNPAKLTRGADGTYHVRYDIDEYAVDTAHQSPSVHLELVKQGQGLVPKSIAYRVRDKGSNPATFGPTVTNTPAGAPADWAKAKEYFRIAELVDGQVKGHLGRGHLNVGQYAIALYRNVQKSPLLELLHPHLKSVSAINTFGKDTIFGKEGILVVSPLTPDALVECMRDDLGDCDWKDWTPRSAVAPNHCYARIQAIYWRVLTEYVESFFATHIEKITKDWKEVFFFSKDLVENCVPHKAAPLAAGEEWVDLNEVSTGRPGTEPSLSPITEAVRPASGDIERLKQACRYAIYHATLWHSWRNDRQRKYAGEVEYARLAIDYTVEEAAFQLFVVNLLVDTQYGYLSRNEDEDIPRSFVHYLKEARDDFKAEGYDLRELRSRINI